METANGRSLPTKLTANAMALRTQQMDTTKGTLFDAYNSVTGYFQNVKNCKTDEAKFNSIMSGNALGKAKATFDLCAEFAKLV